MNSTQRLEWFVNALKSKDTKEGMNISHCPSWDLRSYPDSPTIDDVLSRPVQTGNYSTWTEDQPVNEIMNRHLVHGVSIASFPDEQKRKSRLVEMLEGNDKLMSDLKQIAKECVK